MDPDTDGNNVHLAVVSPHTHNDEKVGGGIVNYGADIKEVDIRGTTSSSDVTRTDGFGGANDKDSTRTTWSGNVDFLLSAIGFAVDLANVWRFPYLCYRNGGGAFLIPYAIFLVFGAMPVLYLEMALGQYHRTGTISIWKICPLLKGVGWTVVLITWYTIQYYNAIIAWGVYYLFSSFTINLPWTGCNHSWNTEYCYNTRVNGTWVQVNGEIIPVNGTGNGSSSAEEFFNRGVLGVHNSTGIDDIGGISWQLLLCLMAVALGVYFSILKGVKWSGKVVWVTATLPYIVITILLIRGATLPGSAQGIKYYLTPDFTRLQTPQVWIDAAIQIFYSTGVGFGAHITYASYSKFDNNIYRSALITSAMNCVTSFFAGFAIFAVLGYMAQRFDRPIDDVATDGPGLVFVVYPEAIATLPGSTAWAILFYIMLITLGLDSSFAATEAIITGLIDEFPNTLKDKRAWVVTGVIGSIFVFSLFNVTYGGLYVVTLEDTHVAGASLLFAVTIEVVAVSWFYGLNNFTADVKEMVGFSPGPWWRFCWKISAPLFLTLILLVGLILSAPLTLDDYVYPTWANVIGWLLTISSMILVPFYAVYELVNAKGGSFKEKFVYSITPVKDRSAMGKGDSKRLELKHWLSM
ncbi:sodium-dependent noradrenaline transporter-like [Amphiura filiformis]|uniref:sodium-dependent noradrenaline transporter-like n=1 Tax=Amphiura filiformis TaxID=82378 RepID=UPI003B211F41